MTLELGNGSILPALIPLARVPNSDGARVHIERIRYEYLMSLLQGYVRARAYPARLKYYAQKVVDSWSDGVKEKIAARDVLEVAK